MKKTVKRPKYSSYFCIRVPISNSDGRNSWFFLPAQHDFLARSNDFRPSQNIFLALHSFLDTTLERSNYSMFSIGTRIQFVLLSQLTFIEFYCSWSENHCTDIPRPSTSGDHLVQWFPEPYNSTKAGNQHQKMLELVVNTINILDISLITADICLNFLILSHFFGFCRIFIWSCPILHGRLVLPGLAWVSWF